MADASTARPDLARRLLTAAVWVPAIVYLLYAGPPWGFPLLALLSALVAAHELFAMVAPAHRRLRAYGVLATAVVFLLVAVPSLRPHFALGVVGLVCAGMLVALAAPEPIEGAAARVGWAVAGPLYAGALFATLAAIFAQPHGPSWVVLALLCGFLSDTAGYFVGRAFGRRKLSPVVSPKKTIEGSLGGLLGGVASAFALQATFLPVLPLAHVAPLALIATAAGQAGDLCESLIKRSAGVKDSGTILPGHGGVLDRSDAIMFSSAVVWLYLTLAA